MKLFITGAAGQLGHGCTIEAVKRGHTVFPCDVTIAKFSEFGTHRPAFHQLVITKRDDVLKTMEAYRPD